MNRSICWARVPVFIRVAVEDFPFNDQQEASEFLLLLTGRVRAWISSKAAVNEARAKNCRADCAFAPHCPVVMKCPPVADSHAATNHRLEWGWNLYHEMLAGARFIGRCTISNWIIEVPDIYSQVYELVVNKHMLDHDRRSCLAKLERLPSDPWTRSGLGWPWHSGHWEPVEQPLEAALSKHRRRVKLSLELDPDQRPLRTRKSLPRDLVPFLLASCRSLKLARAALEKITESLQLEIRTGDVSTEILKLLQDRNEGSRLESWPTAGS